jgi:hypothetical protein
LWSAYAFQRTRGHLDGVRSFEDYISICDERRRTGTRQGPYFGGLTISYYGDYLGDWLDLFGDDVRVMFADDLFADARAVVKRLCRWLSLDEEVAESFDYGIRNKATHARSVTVSKWARRMKRMSDGLLKRSPAASQALRRVYVRANTGELDEHLRPETRRLLEEMFAGSNRAVAGMLRDHGYQDLPPWLEQTGRVPQPPEQIR